MRQRHRGEGLQRVDVRLVSGREAACLPRTKGSDCRPFALAARRVINRVARPSVTGDFAAVDVQDLAGNEVRRLEVKDAVDDVADLSHVPDGR